MIPRENRRPRSGLVVPVLTALDEIGGLIESDQRSLVRYVIQDQQGADVIFAAGEVGEREWLRPAVWRRLVRVCAEEVAKASATLDPQRTKPEVWAGISARTRAQTLDNLAEAVACGVDAVVLAPLAIHDLEDSLQFLMGDVAEAIAALGSGVSLYLDDERSSTGSGPKQIPMRVIRAASRLEFLRGIAVSGTSRRFGSYAKAGSGDRNAEMFGVYASEPQQILNRTRIGRRWSHPLSVSWTRRQIGYSKLAPPVHSRLGGGLPTGVVAASANAFPREWAHAWQACCVGEAKSIESCRDLLEMFRVRTHEAGGRRTIACYKRALQVRGVIASAAVAEGTPSLRYPDVERFDRAFEDAQSHAEEHLDARYVSSHR